MRKHVQTYIKAVYILTSNRSPATMLTKESNVEKEVHFFRFLLHNYEATCLLVLYTASSSLHRPLSYVRYFERLVKKGPIVDSMKLLNHGN